MLGKIKKALGIEGVKVKLKLRDTYQRKSKKITGKLEFTTQSDATVKYYTIKLVEQYSRGRGKKKLTDEYELGKIRSQEGFEITKDQIVEVDFELEYEWLHSEMDRLQEGNFLAAGLIGLAKKIKGVSSTYHITVEADISGTKLDPFDRAVLTFH